MNGTEAVTGSGQALLSAPDSPVHVSRYQSRPGRRALVIADLADLHGPASGVVELPIWLFWQPNRTFDLDEPAIRRWAYQIVLREASRATDLTEFLNAAVLAELWPDLRLPRGVRQAWEELHRDIAAIALRAAAKHGFALAGGNALLAHEFVVRETEDVDLFTNVETGVEAAADAVEAALRKAGFTVVRQDETAGLADIFEGMGEGLAEWIVTAPDGRQTMLQLSYFDREHEPVRMDLGPVLDLEDLIGQKVCALASRIEVRDYIDTAQALRERTAGELIRLARRRDPGLGDRDFAEAGQELDRLTDAQFAQYGLTPDEVAGVREAFADWPR